MFRLAFPAALAVLLLANAGTSRAEADKGAKAIIAKAIEAKGGAAAIEKNKAITYKFKGKFHGAGLEADMTGTLRLMQPDKQRTEASLDAAGQAISYLLVFAGKKGWMSINGNPEEMSNDQLAESRENVHLEGVADLRGLTGDAVKLTSLGESKVDGKSAVGVKVSEKGYRDISLFFDKDSGMLLKSEMKGKDPNAGDEFTGATTYGDYKKVDGVMVPHKRAETHDGKPYLEMEMSSIALSDKLDDKDFAKP